MTYQDTIYSVSSGHLPSAIAIIRISGPDAKKVFDFFSIEVPDQNCFKYHLFRDPMTDRVIDEGLVLYFDARKSITGEDLVEFQVHGSAAVVRQFFSLFSNELNFRMAEAGEFTRRGFVSGRLDLTQAEGLGLLLEAETSFQKEQASRVYQGAYNEIYQVLKDELVSASSLISTQLDFSDEEELEGLDLEPLSLSIKTCLALLERFKLNQSMIVRDGIQVVLAGSTNVGKSSLFNRIVGINRAIVSDEAGTTRDINEVFLDVNGYPVRLYDTAGLRETDSMSEQIGISKTYEHIERADILFLLVTRESLSELDSDVVSKLKGALKFGQIIAVIGQCDQLFTEEIDCIEKELLQVFDSDSLNILKVSCMDELIFNQFYHEFCHNILPSIVSFEDSLALTERQRHILLNLRVLFSETLELIESNSGLELISDNLHRSLSSLSEFIGIVTVDDILDDIFSRFCLGK